MSSKWSSDDEEKSNGGHQSPLTPNSPPSEQKQGGEKRPRRPRLGCGETSADDMKNEDTEKPASILKTITGGWGLDVEGSTTRNAESKAGLTKIGATGAKRIGRGRRNHFDNEETETLIIPDLEDDGKEDITSKVAAAPKNTTKRVPTLRELDEDLKYSVPSAVDGLDMSLLTRTLVPPEMLERDDTPWDFDSLLQTVTQEYNAEKIMDATGVQGRIRGPVGAQDTGSNSSGSRSARSSRTVVA